MPNARILSKINNECIKRKFVENHFWQSKKVYEKIGDYNKKPHHIFHLNTFAAKVVLTNFCNKDAQYYLIYLFEWEKFHIEGAKFNKLADKKSLADLPDWKEDFIH